jgi:CheY-like chemotaxis protein
MTGRAQQDNAVVTTADSATDAFSLLRQEQFDLILLDIIMSAARGHWIKEKNLGLGLLTRFRDLGVTAPVLMMTGIAKDVAKEVKGAERGSGGRSLQADCPARIGRCCCTHSEFRLIPRESRALALEAGEGHS